GRRVGVDAPHHADRARGVGGAPQGALRVGGDRRGHRPPDLLAYHPSAPAPHHHRRRALSRHRRAEDVRYHLRDDPGRAGERHRDHQPPALQPGVLVLQHRLRLFDGGRPVRDRDGRLADLDEGQAGGMAIVLTRGGAGPARRGRRRPRIARALQTGGFYALVVLAMVPTVFVFYWMVTLSLKTHVEAAGYPPHFFRFAVTFANYAEVFEKNPFLVYVMNSLVVAVGCTLVGLAVGLPAAFSIARWR